jgi:RNA polymerase subunit RPABC4/transcription elongation factor Spt4
MEKTCNRCHQTIQPEDCYCPACGLPQLVYAAEGAAGETQPEVWEKAVRDAGTLDWKPALRAALLMAIPAGLLSSEVSPTGRLGLFWMASAAAWAVVIYMRSQKPAWITLGAGARIGLVTGLLGSWLAFGVSGGVLLVERFLFHQGGQIDAEYSSIFISKFQQTIQQTLAGMGPADAAQAQTVFAGMLSWMTSPEGHAAMWAGSLAFSSLFLLLFAVCGGALGARIQAGRRRPEV